MLYMFKTFVSLLSGHTSYIAATAAEPQILITKTLTDSSPFPLTDWHWQYALAVLLNINAHQSPFWSVSGFNMHPPSPPTPIMTIGSRNTTYLINILVACFLNRVIENAVLLYMCCTSRIWEHIHVWTRCWSNSTSISFDSMHCLYP